MNQTATELVKTYSIHYYDDKIINLLNTYLPGQRNKFVIMWEFNLLDPNSKYNYNRNIKNLLTVEKENNYRFYFDLKNIPDHLRQKLLLQLMSSVLERIDEMKKLVTFLKKNDSHDIRKDALSHITYLARLILFYYMVVRMP